MGFGVWGLGFCQATSRRPPSLSLAQAQARFPVSPVYSPPQVDRIWATYVDLIIIYPKPYSIYLRGVTHIHSWFPGSITVIRVQELRAARSVSGRVEPARLHIDEWY